MVTFRVNKSVSSLRSGGLFKIYFLQLINEKTDFIDFTGILFLNASGQKFDELAKVYQFIE